MPTQSETFFFEGTEPTRLDRYLCKHWPELSRNYIQALIQERIVRINGKAVRKGYVLAENDRISVAPFLKPQEREIHPNPAIELDVVWESLDFLVLNKQSKMPTHPNHFEDKNTIANALIGHFPDIRGVGDNPLRPGIVHRLDTNTSGLLLVARTQSTFKKLRTLFDQRLVKKTYLALVLGDVERAGEISIPLAHHKNNPRKMVALKKEGINYRSRPREAQTKYEPLERFGNYTLLSVKTLTGRMHQIRVHMSAIGHPLVGDPLYQTGGDRARDHISLDRHFLHASQIILNLGFNNHPNEFQSNLPLDLSDVLKKLRNDKS